MDGKADWDWPLSSAPFLAGVKFTVQGAFCRCAIIGIRRYGLHREREWTGLKSYFNRVADGILWLGGKDPSGGRGQDSRRGYVPATCCHSGSARILAAPGRADPATQRGPDAAAPGRADPATQRGPDAAAPGRADPVAQRGPGRRSPRLLPPPLPSAAPVAAAPGRADPATPARPRSPQPQGRADPATQRGARPFPREPARAQALGPPRQTTDNSRMLNIEQTNNFPITQATDAQEVVRVYEAEATRQIQTLAATA